MSGRVDAARLRAGTLSVSAYAQGVFWRACYGTYSSAPMSKLLSFGRWSPSRSVAGAPASVPLLRHGDALDKCTPPSKRGSAEMFAETVMSVSAFTAAAVVRLLDASSRESGPPSAGCQRSL